MAYINTIIKRATAASRWSPLCRTTAARPAAMTQPWLRTFASEGKTKKDDVPRTTTGEVQKQNNFASEVGKKMQEVAPGGDEEPSLNSGKEELPKQEGDDKGR